MTDLAIIIVSYKTRDLLDRCLASISAGVYPFTCRVVVVDNASGDGTPEMVVGKYPDVLLVHNNENTGYSVANNQGIRKTDSRYVLLLNPDTEVKPETLTAMVGFLGGHSHVGAVGCQLLNSDGSPQTSWLSFPIPFSRYIKKFSFYPRLARALLGIKDGRPEIAGDGRFRRVDIIKGACLMARREALNQVGLLDENSFLYAEDTDWCIRAWKKGWEAYALTGHNILHHGYASTDQEPYLTIISSRRSALLLHRKHYSFPFVTVWTALIFMEILYKWMLNRLRVAIRKDAKTQSRYRAYRELLGDILKNRIGKPGK